MKKEKGSVLVLVLVLGILGILGVFGYMFFKSGGTSSFSSSSSSSVGAGLSPTNLKGDINRDGKVDATDADLVKNASPCNHVDPCWKKVVGKTKDGDNPIYASDLDLNHDDNVNQLDISAMSTGQ